MLTATLKLTVEERLRRCVTPMTKWQLFNALGSNNARLSINGIAVILVGVEKEDGSGNCFNLTLAHGNERYKCFCRCQDAA